MANLKGEAKIVARQDSQNFAVTVDTLQAFMLAEGNKGHLLPSEDDVYDLGSPLKQWKDLYLTGNSIYLGGIKLSDDGTGQLHVEDSSDPGAEIKFDLSTSLIGDLKDVEVAGVEDGQVLSWNEAAGEWRATEGVSSSLHFYGVIGTEANETLTPDGNETAGDFYLVHGTHQLTGWNGIADGTEVDNADMVVLGADNTTWQHLNDVIGGGGVTSIASETDALVVDNTIPTVPRLSISNATTTTAGLMSRQDKVKLDEVDDTYVAVEGDTMTGPLEIFARDDVLDGENMFAVQGVQGNNRTGQNIFRIVKKDDGTGDQARYYGPVTFDNEITTKEYVDGEIKLVESGGADARNAVVPGAHPTTENFAISRKMHNSIYDEETGVLMSYRSIDDNWNDDVKFSCSVTDTEEDNPKTKTQKVLEEYKTGNNNEYISLIGHVKYDGKYILFPRDRPFDQSVVYFDPNEIDSDGFRGVVSNYPNQGLVFAEENCSGINTATPLTSDNRYVIVAGQEEGRLPGNYLNTTAATYIVDLENVKNDVEYKTFTREYTGTGTGSNDRRAAAKQVVAEFGGFSRGVDNEDGTYSVYLFHAGHPIKKVIVNDLANLDVSLQDVSAALPKEYLMLNGGRVSYKGRLTGITVFQNRYIVFFAQNVGIYSFDTSDDSLTLIHDIAANGDHWLQYGLNHYDWNAGVPEIDGSLYFVPHSTKGQNNVDYDTKILIVKPNLTVEERPFDIPGYASDNAVKSGPFSLMIFNNNRNNHQTFTGDVAWVYDVLKNEFTELKLPSECYGGVPYKNGGLILTPNTKQSAANKWNYRKHQYVLAGAGINPELIRNSDLTVNSAIKELQDLANEAYDNSVANEDAIVSLEDGLNDIVNPHVKILTEKTTNNSETFEHIYPLYEDDEQSVFHHLIPQRFVLLAKYYAGSSNRTDWIDDNTYSLDAKPNMKIVDTKTGKELDVVDGWLYGEDNTTKVYPPMRGGITKSHADGSVDVYFWIHNPHRCTRVTTHTWGEDTCPLFRIHIPSAEDINDGSPFDNITTNWTNIRMEKAKFTRPNKNPYYPYDDSILDNDKFQYQILPYTITLRDDVDSGKPHYFFMSGPATLNGGGDYATHRVMEVFFDETDPDEGRIEPPPVTGGNESNAWGYVGGSFLIKKDSDGIERCFIHSQPHGISELFFVNHNGERKGKVQHHPNYTPFGTRLESLSKTNKFGQPIIEQKGIETFVDGDSSAIQWLNKHTLDPNDEYSCTVIYHYGKVGVVAVNLSAIVARDAIGIDEYANYTRLLNNYEGDLNCMHIYTGDNAWEVSYMKEGTTKNLMRFNNRLIDAHGSGAVWFFDWKPGYVAASDDYYNSRSDYIYKRSALEVKVNPSSGMIEVIGHPMGRKHTTTNVESVPFEVGAEGLCKMYGNIFILANANNSSSINDPRFVVYDTTTQSLSLLDNTESAATAMLPVNDMGIIACSNNKGTPIHCIDMLSGRSFDTTRQSTRIAELQTTVAALTARIEALEA